MSSRTEDLKRIREALAEAGSIFERFTPGEVKSRNKAGGDPVTEADLAVDAVLRGGLPQAGEGWLSEETEDDPSRLACERVWVVDPLDGTKEFVQGIPEWGVSIGLVEAGRAVAGGILIPSTGMLVLGALETGVTLNGKPCRTRSSSSLEGAEILASRSETGRGEWDRYKTAPFRVKPVGSAAYKLALVAAGLTDGTWTLVPKHEWDVAAGVALVAAAGGQAWTLTGESLAFNKPSPRFEGLIALSAGLAPSMRELLQAGDGGGA